MESLHAGTERGTQNVELVGPDGRREQEGHSQLGEGQLTGQPLDLLLLELLSREAERPGRDRYAQSRGFWGTETQVRY